MFARSVDMEFSQKIFRYFDHATFVALWLEIYRISLLHFH